MKKSALCKEAKTRLTKTGRNEFICLVLDDLCNDNNTREVLEIQEYIEEKIAPCIGYVSYLVKKGKITAKEATDETLTYNYRQAFLDELIDMYEKEGD